MKNKNMSVQQIHSLSKSFETGNFIVPSSNEIPLPGSLKLTKELTSPHALHLSSKLTFTC